MSVFSFISQSIWVKTRCFCFDFASKSSRNQLGVCWARCWALFQFYSIFSHFSQLHSRTKILAVTAVMSLIFVMGSNPLACSDSSDSSDWGGSRFSSQTFLCEPEHQQSAPSANWAAEVSICRFFSMFVTSDLRLFTPSSASHLVWSLLVLKKWFEWFNTNFNHFDHDT